MATDFTPRRFDRENPCTKVELHNCFFDGIRYRPRRVIEARTIIGENAPKFLLREGYALVTTQAGADFYTLTPDGDAWLRKGIARYLELHPERLQDVQHPPPGFGRSRPAPAKRAVLRRTR